METIDQLYGLPLAEFTRARDQAARELREAGKREDAARVKALRKPTVAAGAVNRLVREHRGEVERFLGAAAALRDAQFSGRGDLTAASKKEREALGRLTTLGGEAARQSLLAAAVDDDAARQLLEARLDRELEPRGFGTLSAYAPPVAARARSAGPAAPRKRPAAPGVKPEPKRPNDVADRGAAARSAVADRTANAEQTAAARARLRDAKAALGAAETEERRARRHWDQARSELEKAQAAVDKARARPRGADRADPVAVATGPGSTRGQPQLKRTPRHPFWSEHVAPWLGRRAHGAGDALTERLGGPARRRVILSLGLVLGLSAADVSSIGAIAAQLQAGLGIGTAEIGLLATASALVGALAAIPFGLLVDKTRRVDVLAASVLLWGVAEAASAFAGSFTMLLLTRLLLGAVTATAVPAVASLTGDFFPAGERGRIYGYIVAGEVVGAGVGIGVSSLVSAALGWRAAFLVLAIPSLALAWYLWKRLPEPARGGQSRLEPGATRIITAEEAGPAAAGDGDGAPVREDDAVLIGVRRRGVQPREELVVEADPDHMSLRQVVTYVLRVRTNVSIILASSLGFLFLSGIRTFAVLFARGHFGMGQAAATLLLAFVGTGSLLGLLTSGRLADRLIRRGHVSARIVVAGVSFILAAALMVPALLTTRLVVALPLLLVALAALSAPNPPLDAAQLDVVPVAAVGARAGRAHRPAQLPRGARPAAVRRDRRALRPRRLPARGGRRGDPARPDARAAHHLSHHAGPARRGRRAAAGDAAALRGRRRLGRRVRASGQGAGITSGLMDTRGLGGGRAGRILYQARPTTAVPTGVTGDGRSSR